MPRPYQRKTAAPLTTPCLACGRPTRRDGHCRTQGCSNRFPDPREARETAMATIRNTIRTGRYYQGAGPAADHFDYLEDDR